MWRRSLIFAPLLMVLSLPASAAILTIDANGVLRGATGVNVGGNLLDVTFVDGSCIALFSGCDNAADFDFTNAGQVSVAAQALLQQVFVGAFDQDPSLTFGCAGATVRCNVYIPIVIGITFQNQVLTSELGLFNGVGNDDGFNPGNNLFFASTDTTTSGTSVFARFTPSAATAVPEPTSVLLLGSGLVAVMTRNRRKRAAR